MAELKNKKYIVENLVPGVKERTPPGSEEYRKVISFINSNVVNGAFFAGFVWYLKPFPKPDDTSNQSHTHDFDELLGFLGSDWENPGELNAEIEFWLEDEKYTLKRSCMVFIPKGMRHCPLKLISSERPVLHFGIVPDSNVLTLDRK